MALVILRVQGRLDESAICIAGHDLDSPALLTQNYMIPGAFRGECCSAGSNVDNLV